MQRPGTLAAPSLFGGDHGDPEPVGGSDARELSGTVPAGRGSSAESSAGARSRRSSTASFPKHRRIRRRPEFGTVFDGGTRLHGRFFTFLMLPKPGSAPRLGIVASKKLGGAVQRNRAKRLIRELFRHLNWPAQGAGAVDLIVIPRRELLDAEFAHVSRDFTNIWRRGLDRLAPHARG